MKLKATFTSMVGLMLLLTPLTSAAQATMSAGICPLSDDPAWTGEGDQVGAQFGFSIRTAGDANGDGYSDVIIGAPAYTTDQDADGQARVYLGSATGLADSPAWTAKGSYLYANFGFSVDTAGDVNGDGYSDVIVGAPTWSFAYVYLGSATGLSTSPAWTVMDEQYNNVLGLSVGTAGDVNGDGYSDVIVGAPQYDNGDQMRVGRVYVYLGSATGLSASPDWTVEGDQPDAWFGSSVGTAGDVNGDGYSDVIIGAYGYTNDQTEEGRAYVYLGSASGLADSPAWTAEGDQPDAWFGSSVGAAGDVNDDSYSDVIVGAPFYYDDQGEGGQAHVYLGSASGLASSPAWTAKSDQESALLGDWVGTTGDVNGDGYSDVIVSECLLDDGHPTEGRAYVYLGSAGGLSASPAWTAESDQAGAGFGYSVGTAGDVNGDGYSDVVVGAPFYDDGEVTNEGRAYVYLGAPYYRAYLPIMMWQPGSAN